MKFIKWIYGLLVLFKNFLYDSGLADTVRLDMPVISVGNLTVGGTGKTPFVENLLQKIQGKKAVVSRNYKAKCRKTCRVDISQIHSGGAKYFGDEPFWLATRHPETAVYIGPSKWYSAWKAQQEIRPEILIIDDGFQHRSLFRDFDVVLLDATQKLTEYELLPIGRAREHLKSLKRANLIVLTKVNLATEENLQNLKQHLKEVLEDKIEIAEAEYEIYFPSEEINDGRFFAFSGLADPGSFQKSLTQKSPEKFKVAEFMVFSDHYVYTEEDLLNIEKRARAVGCDKILTTEKDYIKIKELKHDSSYYEVVELKISWRVPPAGLYAYLDKTFSS